MAEHILLSLHVPTVVRQRLESVSLRNVPLLTPSHVRWAVECLSLGTMEQLYRRFLESRRDLARVLLARVVSFCSACDSGKTYQSAWEDIPQKSVRCWRDISSHWALSLWRRNGIKATGLACLDSSNKLGCVLALIRWGTLDELLDVMRASGLTREQVWPEGYSTLFDGADYSPARLDILKRFPPTPEETLTLLGTPFSPVVQELVVWVLLSFRKTRHTCQNWMRYHAVVTIQLGVSRLARAFQADIDRKLGLSPVDPALLVGNVQRLSRLGAGSLQYLYWSDLSRRDLSSQDMTIDADMLHTLPLQSVAWIADVKPEVFTNSVVERLLELNSTWVLYLVSSKLPMCDCGETPNPKCYLWRHRERALGLHLTPVQHERVVWHQ